MSNKQKNIKQEKPRKSFGELAGDLFDSMGGGNDSNKSAFTSLLFDMTRPVKRKQTTGDIGQAQS